MCYKCGNNNCYGSCVTQYISNCSPCDPCMQTGPCPIKLDTQCIIYHKDNNQISNLTGLGLGNGSTLQLILETIDTYIQQIKVSNWNLPCLRAVPYTIATVKQFGEAVDTEICLLKSSIAAASVPLVVSNTDSITWTQGGTLGHTVSVNARISGNAGNQLSIQPSGLYSAPQILIPDYVNQTLEISDGNTVNLGALVCGVSGYRGNVTADPSDLVDGQYWFRTDTDELKIRLNGVTRLITIV